MQYIYIWHILLICYQNISRWDDLEDFSLKMIWRNLLAGVGIDWPFPLHRRSGTSHFVLRFKPMSGLLMCARRVRILTTNYKHVPLVVPLVVLCCCHGPSVWSHLSIIPYKACHNQRGRSFVPINKKCDLLCLKRWGHECTLNTCWKIIGT